VASKGLDPIAVPAAWSLQDIRQRTRLLQKDTPDSVGVALLSTSLAAKFLRRTKQTSYLFPQQYLAGDSIAIDDESTSMLAAYARELLQLELTALAASLPLVKLTAPGFGILANSVQVVAHGSQLFLREGRTLWQALLRGLPAFAQAYREIINADASGEEIAYELFVPLILVPDWVERSANWLPSLLVTAWNQPGLSDGSMTSVCNTSNKQADNQSKTFAAVGGRSPAVSRLGHTLRSTDEPVMRDGASRERSARPNRSVTQSENQLLCDIRAALNASD
jgi:hypothetical protein